MSVAEVERLRAALPAALLILIGDAEPAGPLTARVDGFVEQVMPPLHLPAALGNFLASDTVAVTPAREAA